MSNEGFLSSSVIEAEERLVWAGLMDPESVQAIELGPEDFALERCGQIWWAMKEAAGSGQAGDYVSVIQNLDRAGTLDAIGGPAEITRIIASPWAPVATEQWAKIVKSSRWMRDVVQLAQEVAEATTKSVEDVERAWQKGLPLRPGRVQEGGMASLAGELLDGIGQQEGPRGFGLGSFGKLERIIGRCEKSKLFVLAGPPKTGKSALALNLAFQWATQGARVLYESLEMSGERCLSRIVSAYAGVPLSRLLSRNMESHEVDCVVNFLGAVAQASLTIRGDMTVGTLRKAISELAPDIMVLDYLQLLSTGRRGGERVQEIEEVARELKQLSQRCAVWSISSLSREGQLKWSGDLEYAADTVMFLEEQVSDVQRNVFKLDVRMQRDGPIGSVMMLMVKPLLRFLEL